MKTTRLCSYGPPTRCQEHIRHLATVLSLFPVIIFLANGCTDPIEDGLSGSASNNITYHSAGWEDNPQHGIDYSTNPQNCKACHGEDLEGGSSGVSCGDCHHSGWTGTHGEAFAEDPDNCKACHGEDLEGGLSLVSCPDCHHNDDYPYYYHDGVAGGATHIIVGGCDGCHGSGFAGGLVSQPCNTAICHTNRDICKNPGCHQTLQSHPVHTLANSKGPSALSCDGTCHHANPLNYTRFADNKDMDSTTVCNTCHSPNGPYDGVSDSVIGAKPNWAAGVYDGSTLSPGKEKWCVGCHDNEPALIEGVDAPKVGGDGLNYGYFANGHGNAPNSTNLACTDCHDLSLTHIDGEQRTYAFDAADYNDGTSYQAGYRLKSIEGQPPMKIPANARTDDDYRLCFDSGCHVWDDVFEDGPPITNFNASGDDPPLNYSYGYPPTETNQHHLHVITFVDGGHPGGGLPWWDSDWDLSTSSAVGYYDSVITCVTCHNVHGAQGYLGSTNEPMIRDGELVNGRPDPRGGFKFSYVREDTGAGGLPMVTSSGATRDNSIGAVFRTVPVYQTWTRIYIGNMCMGCHGEPPQCGACHPDGNYNAIETAGYDASETYLEYYRSPN
jgi:hypothetical protein